MQVRLIVRTPTSRRVLTFTRAMAFVGRAKGCLVRIPEADVSRRHCRIMQKDGFVIVEDLRSLNGTYVNEERINGATAVRPGDAVEVGPMRFIVGYDLTPEAKELLEAFEADVELLPEDSEPDFLEDVEGVEWVEEDAVDVQEAEDVDPVEDEDHPTEYRNKTRVLSDEDSWAPPTDLQITDLLEPIEEDDQSHH